MEEISGKEILTDWDWAVKESNRITKEILHQLSIPEEYFYHLKSKSKALRKLELSLMKMRGKYG